MPRLAALVAAVLLSLPIHAASQGPPNFAGDWKLVTDRSSQRVNATTVVSVFGLLGESFTARQDAKTLTLVITVAGLGRTVTAVYNLDGSETRNLNPVGGGQPDEPIFSRATWDADRLIIQTRGTTLVNGKPTESRRVLWIDAQGLLTIERTSDGAATTRSVYQRAGQ